MAKLVCKAGPTAGHEYPITKDRIVLGRQSTCDVQIMDNMSSRAHAEIRRDGKLYTLVDLGSRNGTNLNGKKVSERQLSFGDKIRVGEVEYVFVKEAGDVDIKDMLSKYEIMEKIGEGGMGIVYKANQRSMARIVALKILAPKYAAREKFVEQFIKEARAAGALNHPNIIQVHDVGSENGIHYFSMEFVDGATCMQVLRDGGPFPVADAIEVVRQTAKALEYAHAHRLIHQDIKPDNIMIGQNNQVKLADLGISKTFDEVEAEGGQRKVMGTPHYMAPEAALGKKVDHRVDIYSLGATLYHLLTGKTPYHGTSATDVLKAHVMEPLPPIHDFNPEVPDDLVALVDRMMAKKPDDRYQTATEVVEELRRLESGLGLSTERIAGPETMILRRFAKGGTGTAPGAPAGGSATPGSKTPANTTGDVPVRRRSSATGTLVTVGLVIAAIVAVIIVVPMLLSTAKPNPAPRQSQPIPVPRPSPADPAVATRPADTTLPTDPISDIRIPSQLDELERAIKVLGRTGDTKDVEAQIEVIAKLGPVGREADRLAKARADVGRILEQRKIASRASDLDDLERQVRQLAAERNYDLADKRIEDAAKDGDSDGRLARLREDLRAERDRFLGDLGRNIDEYRKQKSLRRLTELRDALPASMADTPLAKRIAAAIGDIQADQAKADQAVLNAALADLARWNVGALDGRIRTERPSLGEPAQRTLDGLTQSAKRLQALAKAIADKLAASGQVRYTGRLGGWADPDLISADASGIQVRAPGVPGAEVRWNQLKSTELDTIAQLVLGAEAAPFKPAIAQLAQAQAGDKDGK